MQTTTIKLTGSAATIFSCAANAHVDRPFSETHVAWAADKRSATKLESLGLVEIRRTDVRCGGMKEWWVKLTPAGVEAAERAGILGWLRR